MQSLCCVDKRGILSYPDPTVEKVFFMSGLQDDDPQDSSDTDSVFEENEPGEERPKKGVSIKRSVDALSKEGKKLGLDMGSNLWWICLW